MEALTESQKKYRVLNDGMCFKCANVPAPDEPWLCDDCRKELQGDAGGNS